MGDGDQRTIVDTPPNVTLLLGRLAGVVVVIASLAYSIWFAWEIGAGLLSISDQFWLFLLGVTTPAAIGFLVLVTTEAMLGNTPHSKAVVLGRVAGTAVVIAAVAVGIEDARDAIKDEFWEILLVVTPPTGIGFLVLVTTEAMLGNAPHSKAVVLGRVAGTAVVIKVAVDVGGDRFWVFDAGGDGFWAFLLTVTTPIGIGFLVLVVTEAMLGDTPHSKAVVLGRMAGAAVVIAALAVGIKVVRDAGGDGFWWFLISVTNRMGIGFLVLVATEAVKRPKPRDLWDSQSLVGDRPA